MKQILDLHIHSKYSRACSRSLELPHIAKTCEIRGIDIAATGDFTHPAWFAHIREQLTEVSDGIYQLTDGSSTTKFLLGTEIALIKKHKDKTRRVHVLVFAPNIAAVEKLNTELTNDGFNLSSDGRPILGMTCRDFLEYILRIDERFVLIPAHAWTPWFGVLGSKGGYDSLSEAFEDLTDHVFAIETGLSSDPVMNWQVPSLDNITLISNSDAHSPAKLGREANVFEFSSESDITYDEIMRILREEDREKFLYTIEFYPEEGKYHYDGHRDCGIVMHPDETKKHAGICPVCKKKLVIGVMYRVNELAGRTEAEAHAFGGTQKVPYKSLVPLAEIIADTCGVGVNTKTVQGIYDPLVAALGSEFHILTEVSVADVGRYANSEVAEALSRVRAGNIVVRPGYDGVFGVVKVFEDGGGSIHKKQLGLDLE